MSLEAPLRTHRRPAKKTSSHQSTHASSFQSKSTKTMHEVVQVMVQNLSHEGRGVALYDEQHAEKTGKKIFVRFALPQEKVQAKLTKIHKRFEEAELIAVEGEPSKQRTTPICTHFGTCGGCAVQHMHPDYQIEFKQDVLKSHFKHFAGLDQIEWLPAIRSQRTDYRRRARMGVRWREKQQKMVLGFREFGTNYLVDLQECPILDQRISTILPELNTVLSSLNDKQAITHIEFAAGDHEVALLVRHVVKLSAQDVDKLLDFVKKYTWQLYLLPDRYQTLQRIDQENVTMRLHYSLPKYALQLAFSPLDFTQVNAEVNQQTIDQACQLLDLKVGERVLDLFCGLGNFSLPMARCVGAAGQVIGVEGVEDMVLRGQENAASNQLNNLQFYAQDLTQDFSEQIWAKQGFDALLIDPPRAGAEQVMRYVANFAAKRIVYVSCDPATLARDAAILTQQGYRLTKAGVMDMFTHTEHVESMALFEKIIAQDILQ